MATHQEGYCLQQQLQKYVRTALLLLELTFPPPCFFFCSIIALAVTASIKETDSSVFDFDFTVAALNVSL